MDNPLLSKALFGLLLLMFGCLGFLLGPHIIGSKTSKEKVENKDTIPEFDYNRVLTCAESSVIIRDGRSTMIVTRYYELKK